MSSIANVTHVSKINLCSKVGNVWSLNVIPLQVKPHSHKLHWGAFQWNSVLLQNFFCTTFCVFLTNKHWIHIWWGQASFSQIPWMYQLVNMWTKDTIIYKYIQNTSRWKVIFLLRWWNNWRSFHIECELFLKLREMVEIEIGLFWHDRLTNWRKHKEIVEFLRNQEKGRRGLLKSKHF